MTTTVITHELSFADAVKNARKAYDEGRLGAQRGHSECMFHYEDGAVCAIGASLDSLPADSQCLSVDELVDNGLLAAARSDQHLMTLLQELHDQWLDFTWQEVRDAFDPSALPGLGALPTWAERWCEKHRNTTVDSNLFENFLVTAERELGL